MIDINLKYIEKNNMTDIAIELFIQHKIVYIIILGGICVYFVDKIMKS